jgi:predicted RNA binding protein YcfA (HicA-like mRNA interferase family)
MKRADLIRTLEKMGCLLLRNGRRHDWYQNPNTGECQPVPRHREIYLLIDLLRRMRNRLRL